MAMKGMNIKVQLVFSYTLKNAGLFHLNFGSNMHSKIPSVKLTLRV